MRFLSTLSLLLAFAFCSSAQINIKTERYKLPNGLTVILHQDKSVPIAAVNIWYHVGSANEKPGRTGFAHLFEHMLFQGSQNVGDDQHFSLIQEAGGSLNGSTILRRFRATSWKWPSGLKPIAWAFCCRR